MNKETSVLDHFVATFPTFPIAVWDSEDLDALRGMPLDSGCGDDCKKAIDAAKAFYDQAVLAFGVRKATRTNA